MDKELEDFLRRTVRRSPDGRYSVSLPFKDNLHTLGYNEHLTRSRLIRLLNSLKDDPDTIRVIDEEIGDYISKGFAEPAPFHQGNLVNRRKLKQQIASRKPDPLGKQI